MEKMETTTMGVGFTLNPKLFGFRVVAFWGSKFEVQFKVELLGFRVWEFFGLFRFRV